jgi:hypothetical protein
MMTRTNSRSSSNPSRLWAAFEQRLRAGEDADAGCRGIGMWGDRRALFSQKRQRDGADRAVSRSVWPAQLPFADNIVG